MVTKRLVPFLLVGIAFWLAGCQADKPGVATTTQPTDDANDDSVSAKPIAPRDWLEKLALRRGPGLQSVDRIMDPQTRVPPFDRQPLEPRPSDRRIAEDVPMLEDTEQFAGPEPLPPKPSTVTVGLARSTWRTHEPEEVLSAAQPFVDITQRDVAVRGTPTLHETPEQLRDALLSGSDQMIISHVFDYLLVHKWFEKEQNNGTILMCWTSPAYPRTTELDAGQPGPPGSSIELVVARDSPYQKPADLKGARLAMAANYIDAPGAFITRLLLDLGQPPGAAFFGSLTLRRYTKDAVIDVLKGKADVACVDQGTMGALNRFYGVDQRTRTIAISPRYNFDVLYTSQNNLETHQTEIELTQRQITTLQKDAEGQEILFLFDQAGWHNYEKGDIDVARQHFDDYLAFRERTPVDLKPLLDPRAPMDRKTYDRLGDE